MSLLTFAELGISRAVTSALSERGISAPFPVQSSVIPDVLAGKDVLVKSPTGSGKTLAFALPIVDRIEATDQRPTALVLVPTRELATQIVEETYGLAHSRALSIAAVYGGAGIERQRKLARKAHILVATPGRLEDLLKRRAFDLSQVRILVLDEADRMLDMGFRPAVDRIVAQTPKDRQTLFFSATLDGAVGQIADRYTRDARKHTLTAPAQQRGDVDHRFVRVAQENKLEKLLSELNESERGRTLVFVRTKRGADRLVKRLSNKSVNAVAMHGDKSQSQRERALARFESGKVDTLVATDVASRGIDVDDVTHVINFDAPEDREGYVHRIGRTGRAGRSGVGVTFVAAGQVKEMRRITRELELQSEFSQAGFESERTHNSQRRGSSGRRYRQRRR